VPNIEKALIYSADAGYRGETSAILTSIALFEHFQETQSRKTLKLGRNQLDDTVAVEELSVEMLIDRWRNGLWESKTMGNRGLVEDYDVGCQLELPAIFMAAPAASTLCQKYPAIREKIWARTCACSQRQALKAKAANVSCGWDLFDQIWEVVETLGLELEFGASGTIPTAF
jgi:hypothetical protein